MADQIRFTPVQVFDANGDPVAGAKAYFYQTGTTTPLTTYADEGLTTPHPNPLVAVGNVFPAVFVSASVKAKVDVTDAADVRLNGYPIDPATIHTGGAGAATISFSATAENPNTNVQDAIQYATVNVADHNHNAADITAGTLDAARLPAAAVKTDTDATLAAGYAITVDDDGTKSSGTYTPTYAESNMKKIVNGGAFTFAAPSAAGSYNVTVDITNNGSAGAITFTGFVAGFPRGDALTTTDAHKFKLHISKTDAGVTGVLEALQ